MANLSIVRKGEPAGIPLLSAVSEYLAATRRARNAESQKRYAWQLYCFAQWADREGRSLETIDAGAVDAFLDDFERTHQSRKQGAAISKSTLAGLVTIIKSFMLWCAHDRQVFGDFVEESTVKAIRRVKIPYTIIEVFSQQQIRALLEACDGEENERMRARARAIIHTLVGTGLRVAEACNVRLSDVHIADEPAYIKVNAGKNERDRRVILGPVTKRKLAYWVEIYRANVPAAAYLFVGRKGEEGITPAGVQQLMRRLGERAKIEGVRCSPHTLRHVFAYNCVKSGMSVYALSKLLGHSSVVMTERYIRALNADFEALADMVAGQLR